jgi:hypothetical protein
MFSFLSVLCSVALIGKSEIVTSQGGLSTYKCGASAADVNSQTVEGKVVQAYVYGPYQLGQSCIWAAPDTVSQYCCFYTNYWYGGETPAGSTLVVFGYTEYTTMTNVVRTLNGVNYDGVHVPAARLYTWNTYTVCGNSRLGNDALCFTLITS